MSDRTSDLVRKLGIVATVLGATAAIAGSPYATQHGTIDVDALSRAVAHEDDHVTAIELAGWIKERRSGLRVIDVRSQADYDAYHVPTAERIAIDSLAAAGFRPNQTIVLYSEGGPHAAQAWVFLRALGFEKVYFLRGGLYEWLEQVMNPTLPIGAPRADSQAYVKVAPLSRYFGGVPRAGVTNVTDDAIPLPLKARDNAPASALVAKVRRRGC